MEVKIPCAAKLLKTGPTSDFSLGQLTAQGIFTPMGFVLKRFLN